MTTVAEFAEMAATADHTALIFGDRHVPYGEFTARVSTLARELIADGVGPDVAVAVRIDRSVELLVAVHAIVAAGGQYVPIATDTPADRVGYMLDMSGARLMLRSADAADPAESGGIRTLVVDCSGDVDLAASPVTDAERVSLLSPDSAAYTLFTSGSTGRPKGVTVTHRALANRLDWMADWYGLGAGDVFLQKTPTTFDVSVWELFLPFVIGARLVIAEPGGHADPDYLADTITHQGVSVIHFVPSMLSAFVDVLGGDRIAALTSLRAVFTSGEALTSQPAQELLAALPGSRLLNLYGPTEAAVDVTAYEVRRGDDLIPIGAPVTNTATRILDRRLRMVPVGVPGELYLGGVQLARGYAAQPGLTSERFVADPFNPGVRLYRTGDLVRWNAAGVIEYLGRTDFQVKLRGQRLELGEVEAVLAAAPGVVHAAAAVATTNGGEQHLVAYLAPGSVAVEEVKSFVAARLPSYMVPTVWTVLDEVPLGSSGKLDRRALPAPDFGSVEAEYVAPVNAVEEAVSAVFAGVLGLDRVSVTDSFFDLGGNSLSATRLAARTGQELGVTVSVRDVFTAPTVRELIAAVSGNDEASAPIVAVVPRPQRIPLSFAQQRMWFINRFEPRSAVYNLPAVLRLTGELDVLALHQAILDVIERHEILRTSFPDDGGVPYQLIGEIGEAPDRKVWEIVDSEAELWGDVTTGFDVGTEWPIRVRLLVAGPAEYLLAVVTHHIGADGESLLPLVADIVTAYAARAAGAAPSFAPMPVQFADFAIWQHKVLGAADDPASTVRRQLDYWTAQLAGLPEVLDLPADRPRPQVASHRGARIRFGIPAHVGARVEALAAGLGATPFMVVHAALAALLARLTATDDIAIATPIAGRGQAVLDPLVGMFVNTLVLRTRVRSGESFTGLVEQARIADLDAFAHADVPFETVVEAVDPVRSEAFSPLAQVMLSFDPGASVNEVDTSVGGLAVEPVAAPDVPAQLDLLVVVSSAPDGHDWLGSMVFATDIFDTSRVAELSERFVRLLDELTAEPARALGDAGLLGVAERDTVVARSVGPDAVVPAGTVADALVARSASTPELSALWFEGRSVSYGELSARTGVLARELIAAGVGPDVAVGVCIDRSVEMVVAIHAVVAAGGQYVPIATDAPADRVQYMLDTAGVGVVLVTDTSSHVVSRLVADAPRTSTGNGATSSVEVTSSQVETFSSSVEVSPSSVEVPRAQASGVETWRAGNVRTIVVSCDAEVDLTAPPVTDADRLAPLSLDNALYTLFTSGSTGRPKGVTVSHRAVLNRLWWGLDAFAWGVGDRVIQKTPYTFDVSVPELFAPLFTGAQVVIARPGGHADPEYIAGLIAETEATSVHFVPSMLSVFVDVVDRDRLAQLTSLKWVFASGEALPAAVVAQVHEVWPWVGIHNLFGPTEAAVEVAWADVSDAPESVTIGAPVWNTETLVLDDRLRPVPVGVPGELYLGGVQVARGYAAQPGLTAERFVADPFGEPGSRLYRTGDLVRWNTFGEIEYLGRTDFQVKLRGQRVELGEIEAVLAAVPGVVHAAATVAVTESGAEHLVAYLAPASVDVEAVKSAASQALPNYMVPSVWMVIDEVPLNSAGKLDRRALPDPDFGAVSLDYVAPLGAVEELLASVVAGLLGVDRVSATESFFALGGDSIMSIQLASAVRAAGFDLSPREIFERRTVRGMAAAITDTSARLPELAEPEGGAVGAMPVPPVVSWMLEHSDTADDFADFNQSVTLAAPSGLTEDVLAELLGELVAHHPMLSASLTPSPAPVRAAQATGLETPQESVGGATAWELVAGNDFDSAAAVSTRVCGHAVGTDGFDTDLRAAHVEATRRFDTATGQLVQAVLVTDPSGSGRIVLAIHHLGVDAVSWRAIIEDLVTLWAQRSQGQPYALRPVSTSQRAWITALAARAGDHADEAAYWLERLPARPTGFGATLDRTRDRVSTTRTVTHQVDTEVTEAVLADVPEAFGGNVADVLMAAFARAVRSWQHDHGITDDSPVSVLTEGHGRYEDVLAKGPDAVRADLSRTVGWFTTIAPIRLDPTGDIVHAVKAAKEERLGQPDSGIGCGWLRYGTEADEAIAARPLPSVVFNYLGAGRRSTRTAGVAEPTPFAGVPGPFYDASPAGGMAAQAVLTINVNTVTGDGGRQFNASVIHPPTVISGDDVSDLMTRWSAQLAAAVDAVSAGPPGLSPSDVPGTGITQAELDALAQRYPGADVWPLAPLQRGLFFQSELATGSDAAVDVYVAQAVVTVGAIDADRLRGAAAQLLATHRVLRSGFVLTPGGAVVSVVPTEAELPWTEVDLGDGSDDVVAEQISEIAQQQRVTRFDLAEPPLVRFVLIRHGESSTLVTTNHHLILDGWSGPLVMADLLALYATGQPFTGAQSTDFGDYLDLIARRDDAAGMAAWQQVLAPVDGSTRVAAGMTGTTDALPREVHTFIGPELVSGVEASARACGATLATALQVAWGVLLSRLTGNRVVTFGETVSGRPADLPGVESMVGLFINTLPAVVDVDPDASVARVLATVQDDKIAVLDHQHLSLPEISSGTGISVDFDTLVVHESYPVDAESLSGAGVADGGDGSQDRLGIRSARFTDSTHYPLNLGTSPVGGGLAVRLAYLPDAFTAGQVEVFAEVLTQVLRVIAADPQTLTADIALVSPETRDTVLGFADGPELSGAPQVVGGDTLVDLLAERVSAAAEVTALWFGDRSVSYAELGARVSVLARELISLGVGPEAAVGLMLPRSVEMIVAIHAVLAAGGQFVPIDVSAPADRVDYITATAGVSTIITGPDSPTTARSAGITSFVVVDCSVAIDSVAAPITDADRRGRVRPESAAYTIFTSGSTGRPKGVTVSHAALLAEVAADRQYYGLDESDVFLQTLEYTFDPSVLEILRPVSVGASLVLLAPGAHRDPRAIESAVADRGVTTMMMVPSMLAVMVDVAGDADGGWASTLRRINTGGEALPPAVADAVSAAWPSATLYNQYGPTETTIFSTIDAYNPAERKVTIGRPVAGIRAYVLDRRLRPVPVGIPGELYLGGVQVARGYTGQPGLTADRFIADPVGQAGERLYRTGDLAAWDADGRLNYLGRSDFQVKLRGQRLELGEVEAALAAAPGVRYSAATVVSTESGAQHLVAYLSPDTVDLNAVKASVAQTLPAFMVPTVWTVLAQVPLNSAGKLDRSALPDPDFTSVAAEYVAPGTDDERLLAGVFGTLLGLDRVSVTESFFDLGGNSLSAMRLAARAGEALGVTVSVRDVFEAPSVRELAAASARLGTGLAPIVAISPRPQHIPLSFAQQRMWFLNRFDPGLPTYNIPAVLRITGRLDVAALRTAVVDVVRRHEVLRTTFPAVDGEPYQLIDSPESVDKHLDWAITGSPTDIEHAVTTGFDVTTQWPLRVRVLHTPSDSGPDEYVLALVAHHIAADGESRIPLVRDIVTAYAARSVGRTPEFTPLEVQFADYAIWQRENFGSADDPESLLGRQLAYWTQQLAGLPDVLELPADRPRPVVAGHHGGRVDLVVPGSVVGAVDILAAQHNATPFMVLHAALSVLLARLGSTEDVAVGASVAGRGQAVLDPLVGMFVNTLVLRARIDPGESFTELLTRVRRDDLDAFAHADVPFEVLVEELNPVRSEAFAPLAQVLLFFNETGLDTGEQTPAPDGSGLSVQPIAADSTTARVDLTFSVATRGPGEPWSVGVEYAAELFDRGTVETFGRQLVDLLAGLTARPGSAVGDVDLMAGSDDRIAAREYGDIVPVRSDTTIDTVVAAQIERTPDAVALWFDGREVAYGEFGARVNALARQLIAAGVGPETAVALRIPRSVEMVVAVHAVLAAGGQYVPVDVSAPAERVRYMFETAGVTVLLVTAGADPGAVAAGVRTIVVDCSDAVERSATTPITDAERLAPVRPDAAAYTLFTSGSTGRPKGVTLSHRAVLNRLWWGLAELPIDESDTVVLKTPYTFDVSVPELFAPLMVGARVAVLDADGHLNPHYVADVIERTRATMVHFVPSMLSVFCDVVGGDRIATLTSVRIVSTTGEALPPAVAAQLRAALPDVLFYNLYGPTEAAVEITAERIEAVQAGASSVAIGVPVWNSSSVVLDSRLHRVPDGVAGELYLGGVQLARGYAARPDLTSERFVADPFNAGERLYRTGDLVRRRTVRGERSDGGLRSVLEYLGRTDFQVKLRGQRVELGEIESAIASAPGVVHAAATVLETTSGEQHLVGYVSPASVDTEMVRAAVVSALPVYMVPTVWVGIDDVVLNSAGKLDRKALPAPDFASVTDLHVEPATEEEATVAAVYAELLDVESVGVTESFFDIGGNSLSAMRLAARASDALGVEITVRDVFESPSVRELVEASSANSAALAPITRTDPRPDRIPLSFSQQRMWFINQFDGDSPAYNIPAVVELATDLDVDALHQAVVDVVARHEVLRTVYPSADGVAYQQIEDIDGFNRNTVWQEVRAQSSIATALSTGFDVTTRWPLRVRLWQPRGGDRPYVLAVVAHHIAADGQSMAPLMNDLVTAYTARAAGHAPAFDELPVQFADYALWQHRELGSPEDPASPLARQLGYWRDRLAGLPDVLDLPADRPRPSVASRRGRRVRFEIPETVTARITELATASRTTPFMVIHAALSVLLARLSATDDIAIGTPVAGRGQEVLDPLVGMFVNTLVLRARVEGTASFGELLDHVRDIDLAAFEHGVVPFETVVEAVNPVRSESFAPLTQVWLSVEKGAAASRPPADGRPAPDALVVSAVDSDDVPIQVDLIVEIVAAEAGEPWRAAIRFATDLFDETTAARFGDGLRRLLESATAEPRIPVGDLPILDIEQAVALGEWSHGVAHVAPRHDAMLADLFVERVAATPRTAALVTDEVVLDYTGLDRMVGELATVLTDSGVGPDDAVAVCMPRSITLIGALHACSIAGGQFVTVDPAAPAERIRYLLRTSGARVMLVLADDALPEVMAAADECDVRVVEVYEDVLLQAAHDESSVTATEIVAAQSFVRSPDAAAYTMFTSGSTGRPKGVVVSHRAIVAHMRHDAASHGYGDGEVFGQVSAATFDALVLELLRPIAAGGTLVVLAEGQQRDPRALAEVFARHSVTAVLLVPSMLSTMLDVLDERQLSSIRLNHLDVGGEAVTPALVRRVNELWPFTRIRNMYGPTEGAICVTATEALRDPGPAVPIGGPTSYTVARVLDARLHPVPAGVPGELYVGGPQLARGYASRADLTADRFVADLYGAPGERLYRTGDLVRWVRTDQGSGGELEYLGRTDFQVKLRGQRIELGEIESVIAASSGVVHCAAAVGVASGGGQYLVAYVSPASVDTDAVRAEVADSLAAYMVPSVWVSLDELPFNAAGKIDRRALPEPDPSAFVAGFVPPAGPMETIVAQVFGQVLGLEQVSATASFFDLGGNSLSAVRVVERLRADHGIDVGLAGLFSDPTVRGIAFQVESEARAANGVLLTLRAQGDRAPLFCVHPAGGLSWFYGGLAPYLQDRPIYGLQDPHVVADEPTRTDADELAARYVEEIRRVQPTGPYHLLGWSVGGVIAQAMATLLQRDAQTVAYLGVMDTAPLPVVPESGDAAVSGAEEPVADARAVDVDDSATADSATDAGSTAPVAADGDLPAAGSPTCPDVGAAHDGEEPAQPDGTEPDGAEVVADLLGGWRDLFDLGDLTVSTPEEAVDVVRQQIAAMGLFTEDEVGRVMDSFSSAGAVLWGFRPRHYEGDLQVFVATADKDDPSAVAEAWRGYVSGKVSEVPVDTYHLGLANPEALSVIGPELERALLHAAAGRRSGGEQDA
ncbi:amino acid adenylation domain-containing protein [Gordonia pseudamarae]|uniref:Amino acid adenylation domain-containing protein n=1 Tax=Gordonia pseudamarae TaxID=2831662 RepID=A0ABX6IKB5_9ACTN|nr:non-ribosomal peptide synthetase [Gordonia pseudamarae]QHN36337.1 amino acid adenylation domain-containing protein [Gordonia pseudamarae]